LADSVPRCATFVETNPVILADYSGVQILGRGGSDCADDRDAGEQLQNRRSHSRNPRDGRGSVARRRSQWNSVTLEHDPKSECRFLQKIMLRLSRQRGMAIRGKVIHLQRHAHGGLAGRGTPGF
jgi:hypothetical protein